MEKTCNKCKEIKDIGLFRVAKYASGKTYHKSHCKSCESKYNIEYKQNYTPSEKSKKKFAIYLKKYKQENKKEINKQYNERRIADPEFKLKKNISRAVHRMLTKQSSSKSGKSVKQYLEYSIDELRAHIELQLDDKMSWANYGIYWELDHIIPQSCLPYDSMEDNNFKKCWALSNLRPLEASINRIEGSSRVRHKMYENGEL